MIQLQIIGNLTRDAETRQIGEGSYAAFTAAVSISKEQTLFVNVRKRITDKSTIQQYLLKGTKVFVQGEMSVQVYTNKDGQAQPDITLWADKIEILSSKPKNDEGGQADPFGV